LGPASSSTDSSYLSSFSCEQVNNFFVSTSYSPGKPTNYQNFFDNITDDSSSPICTPWGVEKFLQKTPNTAPGSDSIPAWFLRTFSVELAEVLSFLINQSLNYSI